MKIVEAVFIQFCFLRFFSSPLPNKLRFYRYRDTNSGLSTLQTTLGSHGWQNRCPWKRPDHSYSAEKLVIPLPLPHPAQIAIIIHNRDSDSPIPCDSEICRHILR